MRLEFCDIFSAVKILAVATVVYKSSSNICYRISLPQNIHTKDISEVVGKCE